MIKAKVKLQGETPISFSKHVKEKKGTREDWENYESRIWSEKLHYDSKNNVYIPLTMLKNCLSVAANYLSLKIPNKGNSTYTKHFEAGVIVEKNIPLGIKKSQVKNEWVFVPADGKRNGRGSRVDKCFPIIEKWKGETNIIILDEIITKEVFEKHIIEAGIFVGLGRFRPIRNGNYGRFSAKITSWQKIR